MPSTTLELVQKNEAKLKEALAALGEAPDVSAKRDLAKKLRRVQRLRRRMAVEAARVAKNAPKSKAEAPPAATDAPAEGGAE